MPQPGWSETRDARRLLRRRFPIDRIALEFGGRYTSDEIMAGILAQREKEKENARKNKSPTPHSPMIEPRSDITIPAHVIADRDRRLLLSPTSTTAAMMHDPLPGYSALERAPSIAPTIRCDPLDTLIFRRRKTGARYG